MILSASPLLSTHGGSMTAAGWYPDASGVQRYWDGQAWAVLSPDVRADILNQAIMAERVRVPGVKVESHSPHQAVLVYSETNHVLHAILTLLTCALWLLVWLFMMHPPVRRVVTVDPYGAVIWT